MNPDLLGMTGLTGFRTGMADERSMMESDRSLRNSDLINQEREMKNEDFAAGGPLRAQERAVKLAEAEMLRKEHESGIIAEDRARKRDMEKADLTKKLDENQLAELKKRLTGMEAASSVFGPDANPVNVSASWDAARESGKAYGFDIGEYNQQNAEKFLRMRQQTPMMQKLYMDNLNHKQSMELEGSKAQNAVNLQWLKDQEAGKRTDALIGGRIDTAKIGAASKGAGGAPKSMTQQTAIAFDVLTKFEDGKGDPPNDAQMLLLEHYFVQKEVDAMMAKDPSLQIHAIAAGNPDHPNHDTAVAAMAEIRARARSQSTALQRLQAIKAKKDGGSAGPKAEKTVKRRGKKPDGREVIEYTDGTVYVAPKKATE
jgi:hypothetical protein